MNLIATNAMLFQIIVEASKKLSFIEKQYEIMKDEKYVLISQNDLLNEEMIS